MPLASEQELEYATEIQLNKHLSKKIEAVRIKVTGEYIAYGEGNRALVKRYEVMVDVPKDYNGSHVKRLVSPQIQVKHEDFKKRRTFHFNPRAATTPGQTLTLGDILDSADKMRLASNIKKGLLNNNEKVFEILREDDADTTQKVIEREVEAAAPAKSTSILDDTIKQIEAESKGSNDANDDDDFNIDGSREIKAGAVILDDTKLGSDGLPPFVNE